MLRAVFLTFRTPGLRRYNRTMSDDLIALATQLGEALKRKGWMLAVAESCTGGGVAHACTAVPGSSGWFERGFVTYSNRAKEEMLGVSPELVARYGAVSEEVARAMAEGALRKSRAHVTVAVTGIAGPSGGSAEKPVGTVWIAGMTADGCSFAGRHQFTGDRGAVRHQSVVRALQQALELCLHEIVAGVKTEREKKDRF